MDHSISSDTDLAAPALPKPHLSPAARIFRLLRKFTWPLYWWYEKKLYASVSEGRIPEHIGLILDGNRRFARGIGLDVRKGHEFGVERVHELLEWCLELGIPHVTIFVFSAENFDRTPAEVEYLLDLFVRESRRLISHPRIKTHKVRVKVIGQRERLPEAVVVASEALENSTAAHDGMLLNIALAYGGREEIVDGIKKLLAGAEREGRSLRDVADKLTAAQISGCLYTAGIPDPDFIIRTSGEVRLSGFFLWQAAYSEYYFCDALWPAFRRIDFLRAIRSYQGRERRYGC
ncbi:MAG TPA: polyprenyl diphosphate synthase [Gammaproteobacteria bacterium]|nr:polyprenyl diphosphate synthase [Gammaproteobacteria bacterium]